MTRHVQIGNVTVGGGGICVVGGPCSVESLTQMEQVAGALTSSVHALRGGIFKPRTKPGSFQGLGWEGVTIFEQIKSRFGLPIVTEVMCDSQIERLIGVADCLQVGSRNMANFSLLKQLGKLQTPILLKRHFAATIEEFLGAAEYITAGGNPNVILCERGIRGFDSQTRFVLDLGAVAVLKQMTDLPVMVDPSHAIGMREYVLPLSLAAVACGADGLIIECHPDPQKSVSDARQALSLPDMASLVEAVKPVAEAVGRSLT